MIVSLDELVAKIPDGARLIVPPDYSGVAMAATRALIHRRIKDLHIVALPSSGLQTDLLVGANCVATVETAAITLGEFGAAPCFARALREGHIRLLDATCPALHSAVQAAEKGIPFMALRGLIGSDLLAHRPDWRTINNPFNEEDDPIVLVPAIKPDVALFHAPLADSNGNVWIGVRRELMTMAHAASTTLATVEHVQEDNLLEDDGRAAGTIPALYVSAITEAKNGAWPLGFQDRYTMDAEHLHHYVELAHTEEGFAEYLVQHVTGRDGAVG
jgi:glutaconate CoA-transferase subunit A